MPLDPTAYNEPFLHGGGWDHSIEDAFDEIGELAGKLNVDPSGLCQRTDMLADFLRLHHDKNLYSESSDGVITVKEELLEFAASSPVDTSNKPLLWDGVAGETTPEAHAGG